MGPLQILPKCDEADGSRTAFPAADMLICYETIDAEHPNSINLVCKPGKTREVDLARDPGLSGGLTFTLRVQR
jgi:hypothetical protein